MFCCGDVCISHNHNKTMTLLCAQVPKTELSLSRNTLILSSSHYSGPGHMGSSFSGKPRLSPPQPLTPAPLRGRWGISKPDNKSNLSSMFWVCPAFSSQLDMPKNTSLHLVGILTRCSNHLSWFLWMCRSSSSNVSTSQISELTLSLTLCLPPCRVNCSCYVHTNYTIITTQK